MSRLLPNLGDMKRDILDREGLYTRAHDLHQDVTVQRCYATVAIILARLERLCHTSRTQKELN